jgi:calcineurin-like phosphoesterase family protein
MANTFVICDNHIRHYGVVLHCNREQFIYDNPDYDPEKEFHFKHNNPKAVHLESHDEHQIETWNSRVGPKDHIWILGDLAWKNHAHYIHRLNGYKYLIRGNHDKMHQDTLRLFAKIGGAHYQYSFYTKIHGRRVMLSHCPYHTWFSSCHGSWHLYGHCHGRLKEIPWILSFDCGYDVWGGPVPWDIIEAKMTDKEKIRKEYFDSKDESQEEADMFVTINKAINQQYMNGARDIITM